MIFTKNNETAFYLVKEKSIKYGRLDNTVVCNRLEKLLSSIPIMTKEDLVNYGVKQKNVFLDKGILFSETSGTTGAPLLTPRSEEDLKWNTNNQMLAYKQHIQPNVDRVAIVHPGVLSPFVEASAMALNNLGVGFVRIYPVPKVCDYERMLSVLRKNKITTVMTTPTLAYKLLYEVSLLDPQFENFPVQKYLLTGEYISNSSVENIKKIVGQKAYVIPFVYGSSEAATLMYGVEDCSYRAIKEDFVFELVDPITNRPIEKHNGKTRYVGKLIVTWLRDGLLPILRYDTNDIFSVEQVAVDEKWEMLGRAGSSNNNVVNQREIEKLIYAIDAPVFHYCCHISTQRVELNVMLKPGLSYEKIIPDISNGINKILNKDIEIVININPKNHDFYSFSLSPKMNKYIYT